MYSNLPSQHGDRQGGKPSLKHWNIHDLEKHHYTQVLGNATLWPQPSPNEQEFCEMPESQLPDRVLMFMEKNDLPVYIDK